INKTVTTLKGYISAAEKRMAQDMEMAKEIQESTLPKNFSFPHHEFELYASMNPARLVGGDFYDFFFVSRYKLAMVIADVSGKGFPAALFMMRGKTQIQNLAKAGLSPAEIMFQANNSLCEGNDAEMFITAWIGILDLRNGMMSCANAGHEYPVLMRAGKDYELFKDKHGMVLGGLENVKFKEYELQLFVGDRLFVYTDGIPEAINEEMDQFGTERLVKTLNTLKEKTEQETLTSVLDEIYRFAGKAEQFDDITMLGFNYQGSCEGREK
ncbi:MAG: serine/threonine-protein phosphatase, partial [Parasporobacterium sp.]|nr:serine/threonine-protein phosphatase [Parasporobacterium sp.]